MTLVRGFPSIVIVPLSGFIKVATKPAIVDLPDPDLDVKLVYNPPTQTESLFGDTIGKIYRTPIETYKPAFSQQEIQGMLSQRFRG